MFSDDNARRAAVCQGGLVVTTNTLPLLSNWDHLQPRRSEAASELSNSAPDSPASYTSGLQIYTKQALDDLVSKILDEDNNQQQNFVAESKILASDNYNSSANFHQRLPESCGSEVVWPYDGNDRRSYTLTADQMAMFTKSSVGLDREWKVNSSPTFTHGFPPGLARIPPSNQQIPPDTKELMSAALANSKLWLKNGDLSNAEFSSCFASNYPAAPDVKQAESESQALLLAQVHATLQALQANAIANNKQQSISSPKSMPCLQPVFERYVGNRSFEVPSNARPFCPAPARDFSGMVVPGMGYYTAPPQPQHNGILFRHQPVKAPVGSSRVMNECDSGNHNIANFVHHLIAGGPASSTRRQQWFDAAPQIVDKQYARQTPAAEQFYHNPPHAPLSANCYTGSKFTRTPVTFNELSVRLDECYHQLHCLEKEQKHNTLEISNHEAELLCHSSNKAEAELAQQTPGRIGSSASTNSCNFSANHRLPHNPTKVDRLIYDSWREHTKVSSLLVRLRQLCDQQHQLHPSIDSAMETWNEGIRKVRARRCEEIIGTANRNNNTTGRIQDDKDILAAVNELLVHTRRARTVVWCAVQMSRGKPRQ